ncbi:MAG: hypothetical protein RBS37_06720 [Bacteroidales bacterium]|jgi:hypothetical protein|nr:hypothetical protein [Bacteroidales bacterium]
MRKVFIFLFASVIYATVSGQAPYPTAEEGKLLLASKTCIVLESSMFSEFNPAIKAAAAEYWTLTPFEFIGVDEFNIRRQDPSYSFLVLLETDYERDKSGSTFAFLNLVLGKKVRNLEEMPEFCAIPLDFAGEDADAEYGYKMGLLLKFIQQHARLVIDNPKTPGVRYLKYYNQFVPDIAGKTILAREEDMEASISNREEIGKIYNQPFMLVAEEEIRNAITGKRPNTLILHKVGPAEELLGAYVFKMLIGADDARMYYFNTHKIDQKNPNGFLPADLKRLARF